MQSLAEICPVALRKEMLRIISELLLHCYYLPLDKKSMVFHLNRLHFLYLRKLCAKVRWNKPSASVEKDFKSHQYSFTISLLSPLRKECGPYLDEHDSLSNDYALCFKNFGWNLSIGSREDIKCRHYISIIYV